MKIILEFDDREDFKHAFNGYHYFRAIEDIDEELRQITKYDKEIKELDIKYIDDKAYVSVSDLRDFIRRIVEENLK